MSKPYYYEWADEAGHYDVNVEFDFYFASQELVSLAKQKKATGKVDAQRGERFKQWLLMTFSDRDFIRAFKEWLKDTSEAHEKMNPDQTRLIDERRVDKLQKLYDDIVMRELTGPRKSSAGARGKEDTLELVRIRKETKKWSLVFEAAGINKIASPRARRVARKQVRDRVEKRIRDIEGRKRRALKAEAKTPTN